MIKINNINSEKIKDEINRGGKIRIETKKELLQIDIKEVLKSLNPTITEDNEIKRKLFTNKDIFTKYYRRNETL